MKNTLKEILAFGLAGLFGFVVDAGLLYALKESLGLYWGRALSFIAAVFATWLINRTLTFRSRTCDLKGYLHEFGIYLSCMVLGGLCNYFAYICVIQYTGNSLVGPLGAVAVGSLSGMAVNYLSAKKIVFKH